ncbi:ras-related protein Rab-36 isoform X2 [Bubalus bubalis]|uniref:ras-related protein Rab-36 isoform X2 n=1 Tax=Bubalus bubalis TaxID=89462 RepID=UPI001E1B99D0|nr:ras-related protein Rab-36 isoform X2 [Bubalus bubalis]
MVTSESQVHKSFHGQPRPGPTPGRPDHAHQLPRPRCHGDRRFGSASRSLPQGSGCYGDGGAGRWRDFFGREPRPQRTGFVESRRVPRGARCHGDRGLDPPGLGSARNCVSGRSGTHPPPACSSGSTSTGRLRLSKVVVVGDLYVGKTSLIHRFCKNVFDHDYKATIGVDFEIERFEVAGTPFSLQIWDTAGQEKFKCIASAYYRGAQVIITAFDLTDVQTLEHSRQWLEDALRENEPGACFVFLVGTKKDLLSGAACEQAEAEAVRLANEMRAEYWSVSAKTGENVKAFFSRVAALAFERSVLQDLEQRSSAPLQVGGGDVIRKLRAPGLGRGSRPTSASTTLCWDSTRHLPGLSGPLSHPADLRLQVPRLPGSSGAQSMPGDFSPCCRDGGTSTRGPGQQEALRPELLLARPASRGLPTLHEACRWCVRDMEGDTEHPPC